MIIALLCSSTLAFVPRLPRHSTAPTISSSHSMAVSKKDSYTITLLPGDGIGPEITEATRGVLEKLCQRFGFELQLQEALIGGAAIDATNDPFPNESLERCRASDSVLLACIGGYKVRPTETWEFSRARAFALQHSPAHRTLFFYRSGTIIHENFVPKRDY